MKCYKLITKWEKVVNASCQASAINTHRHMRIIQTSYKVAGTKGSYEVKIVQVKGLRLRKTVAVRRAKPVSCSSANTIIR